MRANSGTSGKVGGPCHLCPSRSYAGGQSGVPGAIIGLMPPDKKPVDLVVNFPSYWNYGKHVDYEEYVTHKDRYPELATKEHHRSENMWKYLTEHPGESIVCDPGRTFFNKIQEARRHFGWDNKPSADKLGDYFVINKVQLPRVCLAPQGLDAAKGKDRALEKRALAKALVDGGEVCLRLTRYTLPQAPDGAGASPPLPLAAATTESTDSSDLDESDAPVPLQAAAPTSRSASPGPACQPPGDDANSGDESGGVQADEADGGMASSNSGDEAPPAKRPKHAPADYNANEAAEFDDLQTKIQALKDKVEARKAEESRLANRKHKHEAAVQRAKEAAARTKAAREQRSEKAPERAMGLSWWIYCLVEVSCSAATVADAANKDPMVQVKQGYTGDTPQKRAESFSNPFRKYVPIFTKEIRPPGDDADEEKAWMEALEGEYLKRTLKYKPDDLEGNEWRKMPRGGIERIAKDALEGALEEMGYEL